LRYSGAGTALARSKYCDSTSGAGAATSPAWARRTTHTRWCAARSGSDPPPRPCRRRDRRAGDGSDELLTQHGAPLLGDESLLRKAGIAEELDEALAVELAVWRLEARILRDTPRDLGIGDAKAKRPHALVEQHLAEDLIFDLLVDASARACSSVIGRPI